MLLETLDDVLQLVLSSFQGPESGWGERGTRRSFSFQMLFLNTFLFSFLYYVLVRI